MNYCLRKALVVLFALLTTSGMSFAQAPPVPSEQQPGQAQAPADGGPRRGRDPNAPRPTFGRIAAIREGVLDLATPDGQTITIKLTDKTEFRKDREPAKLADFKVGDMIAVRGEKNGDNSITAQTVAGRNGGPGMAGEGSGFRGGPGGPEGVLGKDYVIGEVKSLDPPKIVVMRPDNILQTLELDENTSLRKGRDPATMADIQVGDHLMARGAAQGDAFVPKSVFVIGAEQWKRMQESGRGGLRSGAPPSAAPATQNATPGSTAPPEQPH